MELHEKGHYIVEDGMVTNREHSFFANNVCVILDISSGTLLKIGDKDASNIENQYQTMTKKYRDAGLNQYADDLTFVEFDRYSEVLDIEGICTIVNYLNNCIGEDKTNELLNMTDEELVNKVKYLQGIGF